MGGADCGLDSQGRPIGYAFEAVCDEPECEQVIDRGLAYACGGMHGETQYGCEKYFCVKHLDMVGLPDDEYKEFCPSCRRAMLLNDENSFIEWKEGANDSEKER